MDLKTQAEYCRCETTSLHGLDQIRAKQRWSEKTFWFLCAIAGLSLAAVFSSFAFIAYRAEDTGVNQVTPISLTDSCKMSLVV